MWMDKFRPTKVKEVMTKEQAKLIMSKPPSPPPNRTINELWGETRESKQQTQKWENEMKLRDKALKVLRNEKV